MEDYIPTNEDIHLQNSNIEINDDAKVDPDMGNKGLGLDVDDEMED